MFKVTSMPIKMTYVIPKWWTINQWKIQHPKDEVIIYCNFNTEYYLNEK